MLRGGVIKGLFDPQGLFEPNEVIADLAIWDEFIADEVVADLAI